jgi:hypothetical protein
MTENQPTILIIDDSPEDRQTYHRYLLQDAKYTYKILEEEDGENGLKLCRQGLPDAILLDFLLPDINGLEFLSELKTQTGKAKLPVVMLTGQGNEAIAVQAMKSGVQDYLVKGNTTPESLRLAIHNVVEQAHLILQLEQSEERFRTSVENMLDCFGIYKSVRDDSGRIVDFLIEYANTAACESHQMAQSELIGKHLLALLPSHWETRLFDECCQVVETGKPLIKESFIASDVYRHPQLSRAFDIRVTKLADGFIAAWRDVTEKRQAEDALRQSEQKYRFLAEVTPQFVWIAQPDGQIDYCNRHWYTYTGLTEAQTFSFGWKSVLHPDDLQRLLEQWNNAKETGKSYEMEYRFKRAVDGVYRWHLAHVTPICNEQGQIIKWQGTAIDIDDRKQLEKVLQQQAEALAQASQAKDEFLAMVSHDLRSPLSAILSYTQLLQSRKLNSSIVARALETIERNAKLQAQLIDDLLDISRITSGNLRLNIYPVNLKAVIEAAIDTVRLTAQAKDIQIHQSVLDPTAGRVLGDANRLQQVIWNLLSNAIKFTPEGGQIQIQLERLQDYIQIIVRDTGKGISAEFLPYVFERFRQGDSTNRQGGLGLGLAIVRYLVELHHGTVRAESPGEGQGAAFIINLPSAAMTSDRESGSEAAAKLCGQVSPCRPLSTETPTDITSSDWVEAFPENRDEVPL